MENSSEQNTGTDLLSQLQQETEFKPQSSFSNSGWDFDAVEQGSESPEEKTATSPEHKKAEQALKHPKVPEAVKRASAQTAVAMTDTLLTGICSPIINSKFKKKFSKTEIDRIAVIEDKPIESLSDDDKQTREKWDRLMSKRDKKIKNISLSNKEEETLETAFFNYFKIKDIALPPECLLYMSFASVLGDRVIEIAMD